MAQKKSILFLISSLILALFISFGCDTSESTSDRNDALIGTWTLTEVTLSSQGYTDTFSADDIDSWATDFDFLLYVPEIIVMNSDGSGSANMVLGLTDTFTWTSTTSEITITSTTQTEVNEIPYELSGTQLSLTIQDFDDVSGLTTTILRFIKM